LKKEINKIPLEIKEGTSIWRRAVPATLAFLLILLSNIAVGQTLLRGVITGTLYSEPIPFPHLITEPSGKHYFGNQKGEFEIREVGQIDQLTIKIPLHRPLGYRVLGDSITDLRIKMVQNSIMALKGSTESELKFILQLAFKKTKSLNPARSSGYSQNLYNKFHLGVENLNQAKSLINRVGQLIRFRLPEFDKDHHLFLTESYSEKDFLNRNNQKERIKAAQITGIGDPSLFSLNSMANPYGLFQDYIRILNKDYPNPIAGNPFKRYFFDQIDTAIIRGDSIIIVMFHPLPGKKVGKLKGYLFFNKTQNRVERILASPAIESKLRLIHIEEYRYQNSFLFPTELRTEFLISKLGMIRGVKGSLRSYYDPPGDDLSFRKRDYNEVVLNYPDSLSRHQDLWTGLRKEEFTPEDQATLEFYDSIGRIQSLEGLVGFGERVFYGKIPYKWVDLDLNKIINFNLYENIRLGLGLHTNPKFSRVFKFGAFGGYGFGDQQAKFGIDGSIFPLKSPLWEFKVLAERDLRESGNYTYEKDKRMFHSERLRDYQLEVFEMVDRINIGTGGRLAKYLSGWFSYQRSRENPQYDYSFKGQAFDDFNFSELAFQFRVGYGEQFIQSIWDRISIKKPIPILWVKLTTANQWFGGQYAYFKWESKMEYGIKFLGYGKSHFKLVYNYTPDDLPYGKLFNGRGGYRDFSIVIHNAFETMRYNEFLSDQMLSIFYAHNFGPISIGFLNHFPTLEMSHNVGFGSLRSPQNHGGIFANNIQTMEKGFFESGLFLNDIVVIKNLGLKSGLGAGFFYRYGPYAFPNPLDNLVFKLALNFGV
jgi:hypothetical protein